LWIPPLLMPPIAVRVPAPEKAPAALRVLRRRTGLADDADAVAVAAGARRSLSRDLVRRAGQGHAVAELGDVARTGLGSASEKG
jgi:hypothetical protein